MRNRGFTLIEVAFILVVVGLVATGIVQVVSRLGDSDKISETNRRLTTVQKALQVYVIRNGCLPCPANGITNSTADPNAGKSLHAGGGVAAVPCDPANCYGLAPGEEGSVPWQTLGLSENEILDAWGSRLRYGVAAGTPCAAGVTGVQDTDGMKRCSVTSFPQGGISINNLDSGATPETSTAAYALVSSGPDRSLALVSTQTTGDRFSQLSVPTSGQGQNANNDATYTIGDSNTNGDVSHFDDITRFVSAPVMIQLCGPGACGNPNAP